MATHSHDRALSPDLTLVIDWGNTRLKTGWFDGLTLLSTGQYNSPASLMADVAARPLTGYAPVRVLVSSTSRPGNEVQAQLTDLSPYIRVLDAQTPVPIRKAYDTPHTLGADRVAAAVGATVMFPGRDCLVLDLGTCLTADLVDREAVFQGGLISPGLQMRFRAMHEQTARLPLVTWPEAGAEGSDQPLVWPGLTARNTRQAMQSGVVNGLAFELNGIIEAYRLERPTIAVVLCGGDASAFESRLKPPIFVASDLVLIGLNRILRYNVDNLQANTPDVDA
jgi:type III pantothenate kinase